MNQLYTKTLYEEVDLSRKSRNFPRTMQTARFSKTAYKHWHNKHYQKQIKFFRTIELHPEYGEIRPFLKLDSFRRQHFAADDYFASFST